MHCQVRSPDRVLFEGASTRVAARGTQGEFAVMDNHAPLLAALRRGALRIKTAQSEHVFACFGGSLRVAEDHNVTILVDEAIALEQIEEELRILGEDSPEERRTFLEEFRSAYG